MATNNISDYCFQYLCAMIILDNVVVTDEFLNAHFCCSLPRCKGWCCVAGDAGAPLEASEIEQIEDNLEAIKPFMRPEGIKVVEDNDVYDYDETASLSRRWSTVRSALSSTFTRTAQPSAPSKRPIWKANATSGSPFRAISIPSVWWRKTASRTSSTTNGACVCPPSAKASGKAFRCGSSSKAR